MSNKSMNTHLRETYEEIDQDVCRLHAYWQIFIQLFGKEESVELLNSTAAFAARSIQLALRNQIYLKITKLTDPAEQKAYKNLSLEELVQSVQDKELREDLQAELERINKLVQPIKKYRNKVLAHKDKKVALKTKDALQPVTRADIRDILSSMRAFMHSFQEGYDDCNKVVYKEFALGADGRHLLFYLNRGYIASQKLDQVERQELTAADFVETLQNTNGVDYRNR
mgnify:CR=1 FL=1